MEEPLHFICTLFPLQDCFAFRSPGAGESICINSLFMPAVVVRLNALRIGYPDTGEKIRVKKGYSSLEHLKVQRNLCELGPPFSLS